MLRQRRQPHHLPCTPFLARQLHACVAPLSSASTFVSFFVSLSLPHPPSLPTLTLSVPPAPHGLIVPPHMQGAARYAPSRCATQLVAQLLDTDSTPQVSSSRYAQWRLSSSADRLRVLIGPPRDQSTAVVACTARQRRCLQNTSWTKGSLAPHTVRCRWGTSATLGEAIGGRRQEGAEGGEGVEGAGVSPGVSHRVPSRLPCEGGSRRG